jgi:hypothetical protein
MSVNNASRIVIDNSRIKGFVKIEVSFLLVGMFVNVKFKKSIYDRSQIFARVMLQFVTKCFQ